MVTIVQKLIEYRNYKMDVKNRLKFYVLLNDYQALPIIPQLARQILVFCSKEQVLESRIKF